MRSPTTESDETDAAGPDATDATQRDGAVSPAAVSQLETVRDRWLQPLIEQLREQAEQIGRLTAERDAAEQRAVAAEAERGRLRWERDRLAAQASEVELAWRQLAEAAAERDRLAAERTRDAEQADRLVDLLQQERDALAAELADRRALTLAGQADRDLDGIGERIRLAEQLRHAERNAARLAADRDALAAEIAALRAAGAAATGRDRGSVPQLAPEALSPWRRLRRALGRR